MLMTDRKIKFCLKEGKRKTLVVKVKSTYQKVKYSTQVLQSILS